MDLHAARTDRSRVEAHAIASAFVDQRFTIKVRQPLVDPEGGRLPALYLTDADHHFAAFVELVSDMEAHGELPGLVLVGVGYGDPLAADLLRMRDLHTHRSREHYRREIDELAASPRYAGAVDIASLYATTDAVDFLRFMAEELIPFVEARYAVRSGEASYFGFSAGAAFGLHALYERPEVFRRYILGSPVVSHRGEVFGVERVAAFLQRAPEVEVDLFLSVGEREGEGRLAAFDFVSGFDLLVDAFNQWPLPGLRVETRTFPGETHATSWAPAFVHGVRALLAGPR